MPYHNLTIDGFVSKSSKQQPAGGKTATSFTKPKLTRRRPAQNARRGAERSRTLMRSLVSKPASIAQGRISYHPKPKNPAARLDMVKASRAKYLPKSERVRHFGSPPPSLAPAKVISRGTSGTNSKEFAGPAKSVAQTAVRPLPSMLTSVSHQHLERLLDHALARADAHKQTLRAHAGRAKRFSFFSFAPRWVVLSTVMLFVLILAGLFVWQNVPQVSVKLAALQANVDATVPAYSPSGFSFEGPAVNTSNSVTMKFKSDAEPAKSFTITQKSSDWDSASLLASYVTPAHKDFQTSQVKGNAIYIYGSNKHATWVNNGVWYVVDDQANLDSDQLLRIAESL